MDNGSRWTDEEISEIERHLLGQGVQPDIGVGGLDGTCRTTSNVAREGDDPAIVLVTRITDALGRYRNCLQDAVPGAVRLALRVGELDGDPRGAQAVRAFLAELRVDSARAGADHTPTPYG